MSIINSKAKKLDFSLKPISAEHISQYLSEQETGLIKKLEILPSVDSTNDYLAQKRYIDSEELAICIAEQQTQGRGRYGHQWCSPPGVNIYMSILWPVSQWTKKFELLGLLQLIAIANLLIQLNFNEVKLKWPNDICIRNKKLGGILIDKLPSPTGCCLILGIGLNIAMSKRDDTILTTPWTDLISVKPDFNISRDELVALLISATINAIQNLEADEEVDLPAEWKKFDILYEREIDYTYKDHRYTGLVKGIDNSGYIIIDANKELLHLHSSHVSEIKL